VITAYFAFESRGESSSGCDAAAAEGHAVAVLGLPDPIEGCRNSTEQQLLTFLHRVLIIKPDAFIIGILSGELAQRGFTMRQYLEAWLYRMEMIVTRNLYRFKTGFCKSTPDSATKSQLTGAIRILRGVHQKS